MNSGCSVPNRNSEGDAIKLWTIVGYNGLGDSEATDDVFPYELGDILVFDASICFSFHPFTEVIRGDREISFGRVRLGGPTMSMPHCAKGQGPEIGFKVSDGICGMGAPYAPEIVLQNDFHVLPRATQLIRTGPLNGLDIEECCPEVSCNVVLFHSWPSGCFASMVLQVEASVTEGLVCTCIGNNMASLMGREAAMLPRRRRAHFQQGTPTGWIAPDVLPVGDCRRSPTSDPNDREAPSTRKVHHSSYLGSLCWMGLREYSSTKSAITWPFMDNLGWNSIPIRSILWPIVAFFRLSLVCVECCEGVGQLKRPPGGLGNRAELLGGTSKS
ncbi:hypothetical protein CK203_081586 [Vitis vinifera]|uniref:Uncharacterized protein n=1 Tax=Vitis vinifera TaxID=29760 RepID=A0A438E2L2_VITVI|nr:hypothetical protein CK203_081586 [Vitis vinifera]